MTIRSIAFGWAMIGLTLCAPLPRASAADGILQQVSFDQHLGAQVPVDLTFRDEAGREIRLADFVHSNPVILTLNYYKCPMLCTVELNALLRSLQMLPFDPGRDFAIVTVSIDPTETPSLAAAKKTSYIRRYGRKNASAGWHFLTGEEPSIRKLAQAVGFRYARDSETGQYAHAAGFVVLTPDGRIARYFYGLDYPPRDLRLALVEASAHKIGSAIDQLLLVCFHYNPMTGRYNLAVMTLLRIGGVATALGLATFILVSVRRDRRSLHQAACGDI
jgi:protein SCO1/2